MKKITIQEIAKELRLSRNTVAKALCNSDTVAYETRHMVVSKAHELGYQKISRGMLEEYRIKVKTEKIKTIAVVARKDISLFWNHIIMGISDELNIYGYNLMLCFVNVEDEKSLSVPAGINESINGMLILSVFSKEYVEKLSGYSLPMVFLDMPAGNNYCEGLGDVIYCEGFNSTKTLVTHLISRGLKKIGFIGDITYCKTIKDRYEGYLAGLTEAGLRIDHSIIAASRQDGKYYVTAEVERAVNGMKDIPEAFVCANDDIAFDVIRILKLRNLKVPEDVAVTGYDDVEDMAQVDAFLTTVKAGNKRLGKRLVKQLLFRIENQEFPFEITTIGVEIIYRRSSLVNAR